MPDQSSFAALNVIGAAALLIADEMTHAVEAETGLAVISAAALVSIAHAPGEPIDFIAKSLRRSHSTVVRLIASLVEQGYVEKRSAVDGRAVSLELTRSGRAVVRKTLLQRQEVLQSMMEPFSTTEVGRLEAASRRLIELHATDEIRAMWICRLCDGEACDPCPMQVLEQAS